MNVKSYREYFSIGFKKYNGLRESEDPLREKI